MLVNTFRGDCHGGQLVDYLSEAHAMYSHTLMVVPTCTSVISNNINNTFSDSIWHMSMDMLTISLCDIQL